MRMEGVEAQAQPSLSAASPSSSMIYIPDEWSEAADRIAYDSVTSPPPISFICGPKNSGKTTFSRHLLNTLLQRYKKVAYLDTDVGQPEFTPPGCLSLSVIEEKTQDLAIASIKTPVRCFFFGDISSKRDPKTYLNNICSLYDYFRTQFHVSNESDTGNPGKPMLPLIVNTPGWVKGIGYDLLVEMLRYISPTHVVQVRTTARNKNLPLGAFWLDGEQEHEDLDLIEINSARQDSYNRSTLVWAISRVWETHPKLQPFDSDHLRRPSGCLLRPPANHSRALVLKDAKLMRELRIYAYFRQCLPSEMEISTFKELGLALASHPPYEVPFSSINVSHLHCQVPSSEVFRSLNATIVGLAVTAKSLNSDACTPWCVGLGIVRGVDVSKDLVYILTPVPQRVLVKINLLLQGYLEIPTRLLEVPECRSPYLTANVLFTS